MKPLKILLVIVALLPCVVEPARARLVSGSSLPDVLEFSGFVVVARPTTKTVDTGERTTFEGVVNQDTNGKVTPIPAIGVETKFNVLYILKGDMRIKHFTLHHYREPKLPNPDPSRTPVSVDGLTTVSFDPSDPEQPTRFLMFLSREPDGRYTPHGGQTDPGTMAIFSLGD